MPKTIFVHSFRHGVGRSTLVANMAFLLAKEGRRVGVVDTNTVSPALHHIFGLSEDEITGSFNDYLAGMCHLDRVAHPLSRRLDSSVKGELFFIPGKIGASTATLQPDNPSFLELLSTGCQSLINKLKLDTLLIDTQPGLGKEALVSLTVADVLVVVLRHDWRDYQSTGVTIDVMEQLDIPQITLIINEVPGSFNFLHLKTELESTYNCRVTAVLPHVEEMMALAGRDIFALRYPTHTLTTLLRQSALKLAA